MYLPRPYQPCLCPLLIDLSPPLHFLARSPSAPFSYVPPRLFLSIITLFIYLCQSFTVINLVLTPSHQLVSSSPSPSLLPVCSLLTYTSSLHSISYHSIYLSVSVFHTYQPCSHPFLTCFSPLLPLLPFSFFHFPAKPRPLSLYLYLSISVSLSLPPSLLSYPFPTNLSTPIPLLPILSFHFSTKFPSLSIYPCQSFTPTNLVISPFSPASHLPSLSFPSPRLLPPHTPRCPFFLYSRNRPPTRPTPHTTHLPTPASPFPRTRWMEGNTP